MRIPLLSVEFIAVLILFSSCTSNSSSDSDYAHHFNQDWAENELWDDGLAEVSHYNAEMPVYDQKRNFDYTFITVKETFNEAYNVKTEDYTRNDLFPVIKVNKFAAVPTEKYPYHFLTSLFFKRDNPHVIHKISQSSQEWCGNTYKSFEKKKGGYDYTFHSYWDEQGSGERFLEGDFIFEDQLSHSLRSLKFSEGLHFSIQLYPTQVSNKAPVLEPVNAILQVTKEEKSNLWKVTVELAPNRINEYWFEPQYPNILVKQITWHQTNLTLKYYSRYNYWK